MNEQRRQQEAEELDEIRAVLLPPIERVAKAGTKCLEELEAEARKNMMQMLAQGPAN